MIRKFKRQLSYILGGFALIIPFMFLAAALGVYPIPTIIVMLVSQFSYLMAIKLMTHELETENKSLKEQLNKINNK